MLVSLCGVWAETPELSELCYWTSLQPISYIFLKEYRPVRFLTVVLHVSCVHPQINTQNGGLQQQQALHGDILSELQSHHPVLLQPAKEVCLCGTTTAQKSDTSLGSIADTNRHSCDWSSGRSASAAFALWWYLHYLCFFFFLVTILSYIHSVSSPPLSYSSLLTACSASQLSIQ